MRASHYWGGFFLGVGLIVSSGAAWAIPGQRVEEATAWIQAHPTLQPVPGERLLVRKSDTPARRFTFQAIPFQAGKIAPGVTTAFIRTEEISLLDLVNGINRERLEEAIRVIYGTTIYRDYAGASVVYSYPATGGTPVVRGELREGDRFAYWLEITRQSNGFPYAGRATVFLKEDLPKLQEELEGRSQ